MQNGKLTSLSTFVMFVYYKNSNIIVIHSLFNMKSQKSLSYWPGLGLSINRIH